MQSVFVKVLAEKIDRVLVRSGTDSTPSRRLVSRELRLTTDGLVAVVRGCCAERQFRSLLPVQPRQGHRQGAGRRGKVARAGQGEVVGGRGGVGMGLWGMVVQSSLWSTDALIAEDA